MAQHDLLISSGHVVTLDPETGDLPGGDVLIRDGRIAAVGAALGSRAPDARVVDARGRLVMPGLSTPIGTSGRERSPLHRAGLAVRLLRCGDDGPGAALHAGGSLRRYVVGRAAGTQRGNHDRRGLVTQPVQLAARRRKRASAARLRDPRRVPLRRPRSGWPGVLRGARTATPRRCAARTGGALSGRGQWPAADGRGPAGSRVHHRGGHKE